MSVSLPVLLLYLTAAADTPADIAARALTERAKMKTVYVSGRMIGVNPKVQSGNWDYDFQIWKTPEKWRIDLRPRTDGHVKDWSGRYVMPTPSPKPVDRQVVCDGCRPGGGGYHFYLPWSAVEAYSPDSDYARIVREYDLLIDPQKFGVVLASPFTHDNLGDVLASPAIKFDGLSETTRNGERAIALTGTRVKGGSIRRVTILPDKGYSVVSIRAGPKPGSKDNWEYSVESEPAQDPMSGAWYTRSFRYRRESRGVMECETRLTIDHAEVNRPIDPKVFTLAGLDIPIGQAYREQTDTRLRYWDGSKVVAESPIKPVGQLNVPVPAAPQPVGAVPSGVRWWAVAAAVLFAGAAVLLLRRAIIRAAR